MDETSIVTSYILANMIPDNVAILDNVSDNLYRALRTEVERVIIETNFLRYSESEDTAKIYTDAMIDLYTENMAKLVLTFLSDKLKRGRIFYKSVYTPGRTPNTVLLASQLFNISGSVGKENDPHWQVVFIDGIKSKTKLLQVLKNDDEFTKWCMKKLHTIENFDSDYLNRGKIWERGDNLDEANKYFFGTENTNEVKKLFESTEEKIYIYYGTEENGYEKIQVHETKNISKDLGDILTNTNLSKRETKDLIDEFTENISVNGVYYLSTYNKQDYDIFIGVAKKSKTQTLTDILKSLRKEFMEMSDY